jgi:hypothetical protein
MNVEAALKSQYHAALKALRATIEKCPDALWDDPGDGMAPFWRVAYHTLFYTHFYLQRDQESFAPWARHRPEANFIDVLPWENSRPPMVHGPYSREELLEYWKVCDDMIDGGVDRLDLSADQCGFPWYRMPTLEHQIVNIRHIQNHAAGLASRLRRSTGVGVEWVGRA